MIEKLIIGGLAATLIGGAALAQTPTPAPAAPGVQQQDGRGERGDRFRGGRRDRLSLEQLQQRNAEVFARIDANKDGRATQAEYTAFLEQRRQERLRAMFQRFSGGQDSITLEQLNTRAAQRYNERGPNPGDRGRPGGGRGL